MQKIGHILIYACLVDEPNEASKGTSAPPIVMPTLPRVEKTIALYLRYSVSERLYPNAILSGSRTNRPMRYKSRFHHYTQARNKYEVQGAIFFALIDAFALN